MKNHYTTKAKHLTIDSRRLIERWKKEGKSKFFKLKFGF
ncbi:MULTISPECIES: helix-turn-helix domain-containing protein [Streptococcus]|nr:MULTISPECIES: helix-turn-helix domain-containing protein [Streptococcus]